MAISDLTTLVAPPQVPLEVGDAKKWKAIQKTLGTQLPEDYRHFGETYGSGSFVFENGPFLRVYNPFSPEYVNTVEGNRYNLEAMKAGEGDSYIPFNVFPSSPGILAWGSDVDGNELYWLTEGKPEDWPIMVRSDESEFEQFDGPMTLFLAKAFKREISLTVWTSSFIFDSKKLFFEPLPDAQDWMTNTNNIYELYIENGNRAGFWVRQVTAPPNRRIFVKSINGNFEGPLPGIPNEHGRPPVNVDIYSDDRLVYQGIEMLNAYIPIFIRI